MAAQQQTQGRRASISMTVPEESLRRLEAMQSTAGATDLVEVLKDAIRLYEALLKEEVAGSTFYIKRPGKEIELYKIFSAPATN